MNLGDQPAFPEIQIKQVGDPAYCQPTRVYYSGMSTRTWLAGQVIGALMASDGFEKSIMVQHKVKPLDMPRFAAQTAIEIADALLAELEKEKPCRE